MAPTLKMEYWDDPMARAAFQKFMIEIHGLDFSEWDARGFWDNAYTPFSFFDQGRVVASVCVYLLDVVLGGEKTRLAQVSGVGTSPKWRRQGLNRKLTEIGLSWAKDKQDGIFLFADPEAAPFYEACGFQPLPEFLERGPVPPAQLRPGARKLTVSDPRDLDTIFRHAEGRAPVSTVFGVLNSRLLLFHTLYTLREDAYEIGDLECVIFFARKNGVLSIFDIVGKRIPTLEEIYPYLADRGDEVIEFHFSPDQLGAGPSQLVPLLGNHPFTKGNFPIPQPVFPFTSRA